MRLFVSIASLLVASQSFADARDIGFADLPDPAALIFEDPFREMGFEMLEELRTVVRLEERLAKEDANAELRSRLEGSLAEAKAVLQAKGHDVKGLLAQRWIVAANRKQATIATNPELKGAEVAIVGFLIPAGTGEMGKPMGYLVPEVGMCSHMLPPPPNQLVRVELAAPSPVKSLYAAVKVSGRLHPQPSDETIYMLDGKIRMVSMWTLEGREAEEIGPSNGQVAVDASQERRNPFLGAARKASE